MATSTMITKDIMRMESSEYKKCAFGVQTSDSQIYKVYGYDTSYVPMVAVINKMNRNKDWDLTFKKF